MKDEKTTQDSDNQLMMDQINVLIQHLRENKVLDQFLCAVETEQQDGSNHPLLDSHTLRQMILKGLWPHKEEIMKKLPPKTRLSFSIHQATEQLVNLLKYSWDEKNQIFFQSQNKQMRPVAQGEAIFDPLDSPIKRPLTGTTTLNILGAGSYEHPQTDSGGAQDDFRAYEAPTQYDLVNLKMLKTLYKPN